MQQQPNQPQLWHYIHGTSLIIEQLTPHEYPLINTLRPRSFNVTFPNKTILRLNLLQTICNNSQTQLEFVNCVEQQFLKKFHLSKQSNSSNKHILFYCNQKTHLRTCIKLINPSSFNQQVLEFLALRKLLFQQRISPSFNHQLFRGFDGMLLEKYLIYGEKCHLPIHEFLQHAVQKGYGISRFANQIKYLYQDLRAFQIVPSCHQKTEEQQQRQQKFWDLDNFMYEIQSKSILIRPSAIQKSKIILQDSRTLSLLTKSQHPFQNHKPKYFTGPNNEIIQMTQINVSQKNFINENTSCEEDDLSEKRLYNFYEQQLVICQKFVEWVEQVVFPQILDRSSIKASSFKFSSGMKNFENMVLNSEDFKNKLAQKQQMNCQKNHISIKQIPLRIQQQINKGKLFGAAHTQNSYVNVVNYFKQTYPSYPIFNPTVIYFSFKTFYELFSQQGGFSKDTQEQTNQKAMIYETMKQLTQILVNRYQNELNYKEQEQMLKHQKMILMKVNANCQVEACIQIVQFKLGQLSIQTSTVHSKRQKLGQKRESSPSYLSPLEPRGSLIKKQPASSSQKSSSQERNEQVSKDRNSPTHNGYSQHLYQYENIILWQEISIKKNLNNMWYGANRHNSHSQGNSGKTELTGSKSSLSHHSGLSGAKQNMSIEELRLQLSNQINHYKNEISRVQIYLAQQASCLKHVVAQGGSQQQDQQAEESIRDQLPVSSQQFVRETIKSNLMILEFTTRIHYFLSLLKRLPPLYDFQLCLYYLDKVLKVIQIANSTIAELKHIDKNHKVKQEKTSEQFIWEMKEFQKTFMQIEIVSQAQKLAILTNFIHEPQTISLCQTLSDKVQNFYGKYHWWNILVQLIKTKLIQTQYFKKISHSYFAHQGQIPKTNQQTLFAQYKEELLEIYLYIKQIEYINGCQTMISFLQTHPRIAKKLIDLDRQLLKLSNKDFDLNFLLEQKVAPFKSLNLLYSQGLYRIVVNDNRANYNNSLIEKEQYTLALSNPISQIIKSLESTVLPSLHQERENFNSQLKQYLLQTIKSLSQTDPIKINVSVIQSKFLKFLNFILDHYVIDSQFTGIEAKECLKQLDSIMWKKPQSRLSIKISGVMINLQINYLMVKTVFYTFIAKYSPITSPQTITSVKQQLTNHLKLIRELLSANPTLNPYIRTHLYSLETISHLQYLSLFSVQQLRTLHKNQLQNLSKKIKKIIQYLCHITKNTIFRQAVGLETFCGEKLIPQLIRVLENKLLYLGLVLRDQSIVWNYYNKILIDFSMMYYNNNKYLSERPSESSHHKNQCTQSAVQPIQSFVQPIQSEVEDVSNIKVLPSNPTSKSNKPQTLNNQPLNLSKQTTVLQQINDLIDYNLLSLNETINCLPVKFHSSVQDLILLSQINYHEGRYLLSFEYLQIAINLIFKNVFPIQFQIQKKFSYNLNSQKHHSRATRSFYCNDQFDVYLVDVLSKMIRILLKWGRDQLTNSKDYFIKIGIQKILSTIYLLKLARLAKQGTIDNQNTNSTITSQKQMHFLSKQHDSSVTSRKMYHFFLMAFIYSSAEIVEALLIKHNYHSQSVIQQRTQQPIETKRSNYKNITFQRILKSLLLMDREILSQDKYVINPDLAHSINKCLVQYKYQSVSEKNQFTVQTLENLKQQQAIVGKEIKQLIFIIDHLYCILMNCSSTKLIDENLGVASKDEAHHGHPQIQNDDMKYQVSNLLAQQIGVTYCDIKWTVCWISSQIVQQTKLVPQQPKESTLVSESSQNSAYDSSGKLDSTLSNPSINYSVSCQISIIKMLVLLNQSKLISRTRNFINNLITLIVQKAKTPLVKNQPQQDWIQQILNGYLQQICVQQRMKNHQQGFASSQQCQDFPKQNHKLSKIALTLALYLSLRYQSLCTVAKVETKNNNYDSKEHQLINLVNCLLVLVRNNTQKQIQQNHPGSVRQDQPHKSSFLTQPSINQFQSIQSLRIWCHFKLIKYFSGLMETTENDMQRSKNFNSSPISNQSQIITEGISFFNQNILKNQSQSIPSKVHKNYIESLIPNTANMNLLIQLISYFKKANQYFFISKPSSKQYFQRSKSQSFDLQWRIASELLNFLNTLSPFFKYLNRKASGFQYDNNNGRSDGSFGVDQKIQIKKFKVVSQFILVVIEYLQLFVREYLFNGSKNWLSSKYENLIEYFKVVQEDNHIKALMVIGFFLKHLIDMKQRIIGLSIQSTNESQPFKMQGHCNDKYQSVGFLNEILDNCLVKLTLNTISRHKNLSKIMKINTTKLKTRQLLVDSIESKDLIGLAQLIYGNMALFDWDKRMINFNWSKIGYKQPKVNCNNSLQHLVNKYLNHISRLINLLQLSDCSGLIELDVYGQFEKNLHDQIGKVQNKETQKHNWIKFHVDCKCNQQVYEEVFLNEDCKDLSLNDIQDIEAQKQLIDDLLQLIQDHYQQLLLENLNAYESNKQALVSFKINNKSPNTSTSEKGSCHSKLSSPFIQILNSFYTILNLNF